MPSTPTSPTRVPQCYDLWLAPENFNRVMSWVTIHLEVCHEFLVSHSHDIDIMRSMTEPSEIVITNVLVGLLDNRIALIAQGIISLVVGQRLLIVLIGILVPLFTRNHVRLIGILLPNSDLGLEVP